MSVTMSVRYQTNKEFVEAAGITEQDAFIAVAIRRIVADQIGFPVRELTSEITIDRVIEIMADDFVGWDEAEFLIALEEMFKIDIDSIEIAKHMERTGHPNWFYNPDNYVMFSFLWRPFVVRTPEPKMSVGEWVRIVTEVVLAPVRAKIVPPNDWSSLESSDLDSDAVAKQSRPTHHFANVCCWGCIGLIAIVMIVVVVTRLLR
ncbi:MAG: hypothetical protein ACRC46_00700 [Thermoguttaceae bacterium]